MEIQDISASNNQKKMLLKAITDETILFEDDNGDVVVNAAAYKAFKKGMPAPAPVEAIIGREVLNFNMDYFVFS